MADGIVGAISLGFQVTRELAVYYSAFKSYHSDVDAVATRIELISNVFERMQATIQSLSPAQIDSLKELDRLVIACVDSLRELDRYKEKCAKHKHAPELLKGQIESVIKRLVYPFRKSTLDGMQRTLDGLIGTVQLMTQITHIDAGKSWNHQMLLSNDQIQRDLQTVLAQQSTQVLSLNGISNQLGSTTDLILASHSLIRSQLSGLESQIKTLTNTSRSTDMVLRFPARSEVATQAKAPLTSLSENPVTNPDSSGSFLDTLQCRCPRKKYRRHHTGYKIPGLYRTEVYTHLPGCPLNLNSSVVTTIGMKFRIGLWKAAYVLETGIEYGSSYIAPHIRYRNLTDRSRSPMFQISRALDLKMTCTTVFHGSEDLRSTLDLTTRALVTIFQQGRASIYDLDEYGSNIIHDILDILVIYLNENFADMGAEMNTKSLNGVTPLEGCMTMVRTDLLSSCIQDIPILLELEWSPSIITGLAQWSEGYRVISKFRMLAKPLSNGIVGSPLMTILLQESETNLQTYLMKGLRSDIETDIELLEVAMAWPDGFRKLITSGMPLNSLDENGYSILDIALSITDGPDIIEYLLGLSSSLITPHTWFLANMFHARNCNDRSTEFLRCTAAQLAECRRNNQPVLLNKSTFPMLDAMYRNVYHVYGIKVVGAQALYDNGFTEIDYESAGFATSLLFHFSLGADSDVTNHPDLFQWFFNKSGSLDTFLPGFHGNGSHVLARGALDSIFQRFCWGQCAKNGSMKFFSDIRSSLADVFSDPNHDCCTCFCSACGCNIVTLSLKRNKYDHFGQDMFQNYRGMSQRFILTEVFDFLGIHLEHHPERVHSALRIMTFDRLGMTHTCLKGSMTEYSDDSIQETLDIHHAEKNDIDTLENLLIYFESEWSNYDGTFLEFLDSRWEPHMEQVLSKRRAIPMDKEVLEDCGINLIEYGPEKIPEPVQESDDLYELTWFRRVVEAIVDGREINREDRGDFF